MVRAKVTPEIAADLHALQGAAYMVEANLIHYPDLPPLRETAEDLLRRPERWLLGRAEGRLVGGLSFLPTQGLVEISRLFVAPAHFRRGIAGRLLREVERYVEPQHRIIVSTAAANFPALALYEKHGYQIVRRTTAANGLRLVRLEKQLRL